MQEQAFSSSKKKIHIWSSIGSSFVSFLDQLINDFIDKMSEK